VIEDKKTSTEKRRPTAANDSVRMTLLSLQHIHVLARWIRDAVKIRQEAQDVMNRDEEVFLLSRVYDDLQLLLSAATTVATPSGEFLVRKRRQLLLKRTNSRSILRLFLVLIVNYYVSSQPMFSCFRTFCL